jgi:hypothetical protein
MTTLRMRNTLRPRRLAAPPRRERRDSAGELGLARCERVLLAVGLHIACVALAMVERPATKYHGLMEPASSA